VKRLLAAAWLAGCTDSAAAPPVVLHEPPPPPPTHERTILTGRDFPDRVIALTWDDGPDAHTLDLARMLSRAHVSATFFVVGEWIAGTSEEPGQGTGVFESGFVKMPILGELVRLGHRIGNHTMHHVLLDARTAETELGANDRAIAPFVPNELRMFRAPGGAWSAEAASAIHDDDLVGPIGWDVDRKDWEGSLYCRGTTDECEPSAPGGKPRVRASIVAKRYLDAIVSAGHGIVLLHDRVGHVGSRYALDVAELLVPELVRRGFVFAAPVLRFSPLAPRSHAMPSTRAIDLDGDGNEDFCTRDLSCALSNGIAFGSTTRWSTDFEATAFGDINGDGRTDACGPSGTDDGAIACALSTGATFTHATIWTPDISGADPSTLALADVNGDGRADACIRRGSELVCGLAP
jgi:peptidoglycan/xylan/chitin deacetylase (PgdA/CDA1 family)